MNYSGAAVEQGIYQLTRTPVEELPEKELLVIASLVSSEELERAVMQFNMHNDAYRIVLDSYGSEYSDEENRWICTRLDAALVSANPPDILNLASLNIVKYAEKDVLEDLTPYIESNSTLDLKDIPDNLMSGLTFDGRLVCLPTSIEIKGAAVRKSQVENSDSWTMEDVYRLSEQHPESIGQLANNGFGKNEKRSGCWENSALITIWRNLWTGKKENAALTVRSSANFWNGQEHTAGNRSRKQFPQDRQLPVRNTFPMKSC